MQPSRSTSGTTGASMGYQKGLDGLRAVSVLVVILYHVHVLDGDFGWFPGGFIGVEVFFVVSGYLITSLLIEEWRRDGSVDLGQFYLRRARRLLPAMFALLMAAGVWAALFGREHVRQLRWDSLWASLYVSNWAQIFGDQSYFGGDPPLLRHLWSLAVEEQWYLLWPVFFIVLMRGANGRARQFLPTLVVVALLAYLGMAIVWKPVTFDSDFRQNFVYLGTPFRSGGLLGGAALATFWTPWRWRFTGDRRALDLCGFASVVLLLVFALRISSSSSILYRGGFFIVGAASLVAIAAVVHPGASAFRTVFSSKPLVMVGQRSYGLYLWHWPVFVGPFGDSSLATRLIGGGLVTAALSELCYRFVETPLRKGAIGRLRERMIDREPGASVVFWCLAGSAVLLAVALGVRYTDAPVVDRAAGGQVVVATVPDAVAPTVSVSRSTAGEPPVSSDTSGSTSPGGSAGAVTSSPSSTRPRPAPVLPVPVVIVGDSQAHSLFVNLPKGIESTFTFANGSVEGCGVLDQGKLVTERKGFSRSFGGCTGWPQRWADDAAKVQAKVGLVVIGAWEVFDIELDTGLVPFATLAWDQMFTSQLRLGIDALAVTGTHAALLEVPCMRPVSAKGAGVPPLPERGDDARVKHLNTLLREVAGGSSGKASFVAGPVEWCTDPGISTDTNYRWDGVHVFTPGGKLIYETVAQSLLDLSVTGR